MEIFSSLKFSGKPYVFFPCPLKKSINCSNICPSLQILMIVIFWHEIKIMLPFGKFIGVLNISCIYSYTIVMLKFYVINFPTTMQYVHAWVCIIFHVVGCNIAFIVLFSYFGGKNSIFYWKCFLNDIHRIIHKTATSV